MGKNMNYIGSRRNSRSFNAEYKGEMADVSVIYFLKSPTGILMKGLLAKGLNTTPDNALDEYAIYQPSPDDFRREEFVYNLPNLTDHEKFRLLKALRKYNVYKYRTLLDAAKNQRSRDIEKSNYTVDEYNRRGYKYNMPEENDEFQSGSPLDTLNLERKKKSSKAKPKRKPVKKVVKKCRCKK